MQPIGHSKEQKVTFSKLKETLINITSSNNTNNKKNNTNNTNNTNTTNILNNETKVHFDCTENSSKKSSQNTNNNKNINNNTTQKNFPS